MRRDRDRQKQLQSIMAKDGLKVTGTICYKYKTRFAYQMSTVGWAESF